MSKYARAVAGIYLLYLRKSRQDDPNETIEEVLSKHETILQEFMKREYGFTIPETDIYREVCSGESIQDRTEIKKVLARIEDPHVIGVVVIEPQRLSRGDLIDCGKLINDLRYTSTLVITPMMTYDLENKMERKFFQDELLRGRDYLEYTKEILTRGRVASVRRGNFIGRIPPYGYDKVKIGKDHTLVPNEQAEVVRMIFDWYVNEGMSQYKIAQKLDEMGIPSYNGKTWKRTGVNYTLKNAHYDGKVFYFNRKTTIVIENGQRVKKYLQQPKEEVIVVEGKHEAIIDHETFVKAQNRKAKNTPRNQTRYGLKNPFAGILRCKICGKALMLQPYPDGSARFYCKAKPTCSKSATLPEIEKAIIVALEAAELPKLEAKLQNNEGDSANIKRNLLMNLEKQFIELSEQEEKQYELLEKGIYSEELFERRNKSLQEKKIALKKQIQETRESLPRNIDYGEKIITLKKAIEGLKDPSIPPVEKNKLLKAIVDRIEYHSDKGQKVKEREFTLDVYLLL
jgi:hypothetical protein